MRMPSTTDHPLHTCARVDLIVLFGQISAYMRTSLHTFVRVCSQRAAHLKVHISVRRWLMGKMHRLMIRFIRITYTDHRQTIRRVRISCKDPEQMICEIRISVDKYARMIRKVRITSAKTCTDQTGCTNHTIYH